MTEAEKALKEMPSPKMQSSLAPEWYVEHCETIRKALQGVNKTWLDKTAAMTDAAMVCKLTDENKALKAKSQGLLKVLEQIQTTMLICKRLNLRLDPSMDSMEITVNGAIIDFNSDEKGVGL